MGWGTVAVFLFFMDLTSAGTEEIGNDASRFCESYVECAAVALLEERLCHGNTLKRPFWLPERNDPNGCHEKLKNDYKTIDKMEIDLDNAMLACLTENAQPMASDKKSKCNSRLIFSTPKFSFARTISYIPTNCFTGIDRRRERECSAVRHCCGTYDRCSTLLTDSSLAKSLEDQRVLMRQRAAECKIGHHISSLPEPPKISASHDVDETWSPTGNINVNFKDLESEKKKKKNRKGEDAGEPGNVNVRFSTATTEQLAEDRARKLLLREGDPSPKLNFPKNTEEFDKKYEKALENTKKYSNKINTGEVANEGVDSLVEAAKVSQIGVPSGTMHHVELIGETEETEIGLVGGNVVTSRPLILVAKEADEPKKEKEVAPTHSKLEGCRTHGTKTAKIEKILGALGEKKDSRDMAEIRSLINDWHNNFRKRLIGAKQRSKDKLIMDELEKLVKHFDDVNLKLIKTQVDAEFKPDDYPADDADVSGNECDPLPSIKDLGKKGLPLDGPVDEDEERKKQTEELLALVHENEEKERNSTTLVDEHGDQLIVDDDGVPKVLFPGDPIIEKSIDSESDEKITNWINEEYRQEMEKFHKQRFGNKTASPVRNDTTCDAYMRCRAQMHLAVDGCAWRFAAADVLSSLAESSESLLYRDEGPCDPKQQPLYEQLYEQLIQRNSKLRGCLDKRNEKFFSSSVCLPYSDEEARSFEFALKRVLKNEYQEAVQCYHDANRVQEKCMKLKECCPSFDECREETIDIELEHTIISVTARINEGKQECIRDKARDAFKKTIRGLLGPGGLTRLQKGHLGLNISRGARLLRAR